MLTFISGGCSPTPDTEVHTIRVWSHQGQETENQAMREIADAFNRAHADEGLAVEITFFPDYQYTEKVSIAAAARDLPDALELDGPTVAQFAHAGLLHPLDAFFNQDELNDFAPTILEQGTIDGTLYALGAFDSALVIYYDRDLFQKAGVSPPADGEAWNWDQFMQACATLQAAGIDPISLHMDVTADEWYTYAFSPLIWSGGGRLISEDGTRVLGVLNSPENVNTLQRWQTVFHHDYADRAPIDPNPFGSGTTAMDWTGHWMARGHLEAKGDQLGVMPLPRMGPVPAAACGSWCWGITSQTPRPDLAARWMRWVTDPVHGIQPMVTANGAVPARQSAFEYFPEYEDAPFRLFRELQETAGRPRPRTPYYAALTQHVGSALRDIARGADVETRLHQAATQVQRVIDRKRGAL